MNGIPDSINWSRFAGKTVETVCVGLFQTSVAIGDILLSLECEYDLTEAKNTIHGSASRPLDSAILLRLVGKEVIEASKIDAYTWRISFDTLQLVVHDSNSDYESFRIIGDGYDVTV